MSAFDNTGEQDWYASNLAMLQARESVSETDVRENLIRPLLEKELDFSPSEISAESSDTGESGHRMRLDYVCHKDNDPFASLIVEVKNLGTDLRRRSGTGQGWDSSPVGQLHKYLQHYHGAGPGTWGIVTNGSDWILAQRGKKSVPVNAFREHSLVDSLEDVRCAIRPIFESPRLEALEATRPYREQDEIAWLKATASCGSTEALLDSLTDGRDSHDETLSASPDMAYREIGLYQPVGELFESSIFLVCMNLEFPDGLLTPQDIRAKLEQPALIGNRLVGVAYTDQGGNGRRLCRGFVFSSQKLHCTALINPSLPGSRAAKQFVTLARHCADPSPDRIVEALSSASLHRQFHEDIAKWFTLGLEEAGKQHRVNKLRHLIRVMFTWLLQERGVLPEDALWRFGTELADEFDVHGHIEWLFFDVLDTPLPVRTVPFSISQRNRSWKNLLIVTVPFLNGSLFSRPRDRELPQEIPNEQYLAEHGLLSILSRYDWTLCDRTGYESETAIDPSMLGELFEQLILVTEGPRLEPGGHMKMPGGAYYTPQDLADEMTADAVARWVGGRMPELNWEDVRSLVHPSPIEDGWRKWSSEDRHQVQGLLEELTVLDPCCGSGVFTLAMLHALWRARRRLDIPPVGIRHMERTIERQLYAADIHPIAVLITRLRLFIALIDARCRFGSGSYIAHPLPNLETKCIAANSLCVKPEQSGTGIDSKDWKTKIADLRAAREMWTSAHSPDEKSTALDEERGVRDQLREIGKRWNPNEEIPWLDVDFLSSGAPMEHDLSELFPAPEGGWDLVIGNPPYQKPDPNDRNRGDALGYVGASKDLYLMFIEAALTIAAPNGCVTLVVPHSIVFGRLKPFKEVRFVIERVAQRVDIRTYDNRIQPAFPSLPWLKGTDKANENRQRVTVLTIQKQPRDTKERSCVVHSLGLVRLQAETRTETLKKTREGQVQIRDSVQWTQAPTRSLHELLCAMRGPYLAKANQGQTITFPATAMYFLTCLPEGCIDNRRRWKTTVPEEDFWGWIGLYNSHLFHAYWLMIGDAFHLTGQEVLTVKRPPKWDEPSLKRRIEREARKLVDKELLSSCEIIHQGKGGKAFPNVNFHMDGTGGPAIIEELDRLLLKAYGLPEDPLVDQMRTIRMGSADSLW